MAGLNQFLEFTVLRCSDVRGRIRCPCEKCKFDKRKTREEIFAHCMDKQFPRYYLNWAFHGEGELHENTGDLEVGSSSHVGRMQGEDSDDDGEGGGQPTNPGNNSDDDVHKWAFWDTYRRFEKRLYAIKVLI